MTLDAIWYLGHPAALPLLPLSWIFCSLVRLRRLAYRRGWRASERLPVPVLVVGNLTVGGTGKTPLVLWLADLLRRHGVRPGIVTRGYGGGASRWPQAVMPDSDPAAVGDEAVLLARRGACPVAAGPNRVAAARLLVASGRCDMIVSDDGLQHYRLWRDLEILVVDGARGLGNGRCLPAGPLREPPARRREVDLAVCNGSPCPAGQGMQLIPGPLVNLRDPGRTRELAGLCGQRVTAVAGIGNPGRFFALLRDHGLYLDERPYRDHHPFSAADVASWPPGPVVMTEKDAVKCAAFAGGDHWYLPVEARLDADLEWLLWERIRLLTPAPARSGSSVEPERGLA